MTITNLYDGWIEKTALAYSSGNINGPFDQRSSEVNAWLTDLTPSQRDPYIP